MQPHAGLVALAVICCCFSSSTHGFKFSSRSTRGSVGSVVSMNADSLSIPGSSSSSSSSTAVMSYYADQALRTSPRVQRIKELSMQKDIVRDLTACELALRIEVVKKDSDTEPSSIDYESLIEKLDKNLALIEDKVVNAEFLIPRLVSVKEQLSRAFSAGSSDDPSNPNRNTLLDMFTSPEETTSATTGSSTDAVLSSSSVATDEEMLIVEEIKAKVDERIRILVREDGSVDWEGAKASGKEVAKFGSELWERLNGKEEVEGMPSLAELLGQVQATLPETEEILRLAGIVAMMESEVQHTSNERDVLRATLRHRKRDQKEILQEEVKSLRAFDQKVKELEKRVKVFRMNLDMEKICEYIKAEVESAIEPTNDQRMFIAEVALIDKQISSIVAGISIENGSSQVQDAEISKLISLVDDDEISLLCKELDDLKSRLGLDTQLVPAMDWGSIGVKARETLTKIKLGLSFFGEGTRLLVSDVQYVWLLTLKAVKGYTLKPREVNSIRRTGKDLLTLIPFTIILIIPLSPVGHVLVFGFIQRFFPEFYPSCYTEKRLNLKRLYSDIQRKSEEELIGSESSMNLLSIDWSPIANSFKFNINKGSKQS